MRPDRFASGDAVGGDDLLVTSLLLRVKEIASHRE